MLFFHKRFAETGPQHLCSHFSRLDKDVYISAITEADDDLTGYSQIELRCSIGHVIVCQQTWQVQREHLFTMCFDFHRVSGVENMKAVPLRSEVFLDGTSVLTKEAGWALDLSYSDLGNKKGGLVNGYYQSYRSPTR